MDNLDMEHIITIWLVMSSFATIPDHAGRVYDFLLVFCRS